MANARLLKRRIKSSKNIAKITKAMEMVSASKMRKAQDQATAARPYAHALQESLQKVASHTDATLHPLLKLNTSGHELLLLISTDKGLVGNLNTQLFKASLAWSNAFPNGKVIAVGKKAAHFCRISGIDVYAQFTELPEKITTSDLVPISEIIKNGYLAEQFNTVTVIYMDFINTLSQKVRSIQLLPLAKKQNYIEDITPLELHQPNVEYVFEPNALEILNNLLPYYVENTIFQSFLEARASEHSSRMVTMKNANENAIELVSELNLEFNKTRQASITNELLDITVAGMALDQ